MDAFATRPRRVRVLGAGIAGAAAARAFADRGCEVTVVAPQGVADGASGIPAAAVRPRLWRHSAHAVPDAEIVADAFRWTAGWLAARAPARFRACGVLLCAVDPDDEAQPSTAAPSRSLASPPRSTQPPDGIQAAPNGSATPA